MASFPPISTPAVFPEEQWAQRVSYGFGYLHLDFQSRSFIREGTLVPLKKDDTFIGILELAGSFEEASLLDVGPYSGSYAKYNKFQAPVRWHNLFPAPVPITEVLRLCGMTNTDHNTFTHPQRSCVKPYYKGENQEQAEQRFKELVMSWAAEGRVAAVAAAVAAIAAAVPAMGVQMLVDAYGDASA
jgi:hypothetical protein